jgi:hypothetical protein
MIFPADIYSLKKIIFIVLILINLPDLLKMKFKKDDYLILMIGFIFPIVTIGYSYFLTDDLKSSIVQGIAPFFFLLMFVIKRRELNFEKVVLLGSLGLIGLYVFIVFADFLKLVEINIFWNNYLPIMNMGVAAKGPLYPVYYFIFLRASPLLVIPLFYGIYKRNYFLVLLAYGCLFVSGTRANFVFPLIVASVFYLKNLRIQFINKKLLLSVCSFVIFIVCAWKFNYLYEMLVVKKEQSNIIRIGHLKSFVDLYTNNPEIIITGMGLGSKFYSIGVNEWISSFEFSFLDLFRQLGVIFFTVFIAFLIYPFMKLKTFNKYYFYAYITYLAIAMTNPYLYSSTGFIMYVYVYYCMYKECGEINSIQFR